MFFLYPRLKRMCVMVLVLVCVHYSKFVIFFISCRSKYELQEFLKPSLRILSSNSSSQKAGFSKKIDSIPSAVSLHLQYSFLIVTWSDYSKSIFLTWFWNWSQKGMVEFIGVLKITVQKGTNLAVRDMLTSDPYVVVTLGHQVSPFVSTSFIPKTPSKKNGKLHENAM